MLLSSFFSLSKDFCMVQLIVILMIGSSSSLFQGRWLDGKLGHQGHVFTLLTVC